MIDLFYRTQFGELFNWYSCDEINQRGGVYFNAGGWITVEHEGAEELRHAVMLEF